MWAGFLVRAIQFDETNRRRIVNSDAVIRGDAAQRVINVRQMIDGHVADESALDGGVAQSPMEPAQKDTQLCE